MADGTGEERSADDFYIAPKRDWRLFSAGASIFVLAQGARWAWSFVDDGLPNALVGYLFVPLCAVVVVIHATTLARSMLDRVVVTGDRLSVWNGLRRVHFLRAEIERITRVDPQLTKPGALVVVPRDGPQVTAAATTRTYEWVHEFDSLADRLAAWHRAS